MAFQLLFENLSSWFVSVGAGQLTPEFFELVKDLTNAKSRQAQLIVIEREAKSLENLIKRPENQGRMYEFLIRSIYCEMLGHPIPWIYIHAIAMTQMSSVVEKRLGYLCAALFLSRGHELCILLLNSIQRDLDSRKVLNSGFALGCYASILDLDSFDGILPYIADGLRNDDPFIRKRAVMVLHRALELSIDVWVQIESLLQTAIADSNLSVISAALHSFEYALKVVACQDNAEGTETCQALKQRIVKISVEAAPLFLDVLQRILDKKIPQDYNYKLLPAPWIQIRLLRVLVHLSRASQSISKSVQALLKRMLSQAVLFNNAGNSTLYEAARTACAIDASPEVIEAAVALAAAFVASPSNNLQYIGLTLLVDVGRAHAEYIAKYQTETRNCLQSCDESIHRKALVLLGQICNQQSAATIVGSLLDYLKSASDRHVQVTLVSQIIDLACRYGVSEGWFVLTANHALMLGKEAISFEFGKACIQKALQCAEAADAWRACSAEVYFDMVSNKDLDLKPTFLKLASWSLGECGGSYEQTEVDLNRIMMTLCAISRWSDAENDEMNCVRRWIAISLFKCFSQRRVRTTERDDVNDFLNRHKNSCDRRLSWQCQELLMLQLDCVDEASPDSIEDITQRIIIDEEKAAIGYEKKMMDGTKFLPNNSDGEKKPLKWSAYNSSHLGTTRGKLPPMRPLQPPNIKDSWPPSSIIEESRPELISMVTSDDRHVPLARLERSRVWSEQRFQQMTDE